MNSLTITGNLGKDAEVRYLANGDAVATFSVADSQGKDKPSIWWRCSLYGKRVEPLSKYLVKGQTVTVIGNVTEREYEKDGVKKTLTDVRVHDLALQGNRPTTQSPARNAQPARDAIDDSDIPF